MTQSELAGRVAIVTGGGAGVGKAIAQRYAAADARVVVFGRRLEPLTEVADAINREPNSACLPVAGDVSSETDVARLFDETVRHFGAVDILVNNAAIAGEVGPSGISR